MQILPLTGNHDRQGFDCGRQELNDWLRKVARQHQDKGLSKTFVATREDAPDRILRSCETTQLPKPFLKRSLVIMFALYKFFAA